MARRLRLAESQRRILLALLGGTVAWADTQAFHALRRRGWIAETEDGTSAVLTARGWDAAVALERTRP